MRYPLTCANAWGAVGRFDGWAEDGLVEPPVDNDSIDAHHDEPRPDGRAHAEEGNDDRE
jgi:hypothetical protein